MRALALCLLAGAATAGPPSQEFLAEADGIRTAVTAEAHRSFGLFFMGFANEPNRFSADHLDSRARAVEHFYRIVSRGKWTTDARAYQISSDFTRQQCLDQRAACTDPVCFEDKTACELGFEGNVRSYIEANGLDFDFVSFVYAISNPFQCGIAGTPSTESFIWCDNEATLLHEIGHSFGLGHAGRVTNEAVGLVEEYGDTTSVMGSAFRTLFNSPELLFLGLNDAEATRHVDATEKVFLAPIEWKPQSIRPGEFQHAVISKNGETFFVSTRKSPGKYNVPFTQSDRVFVHALRNGDASASALVSVLRVGETWESAARDIKVAYKASRDGVAEVDLFHARSDPQPPIAEFPATLKEVAPLDPLRLGHGGSWYDPHTSGQGFDIEVLTPRNEVLVYWYTYGMFGSPAQKKYFLGLGPVVNGVGEIELFKTSGGQFDAPRNVATEFAGTARLYFDSCDRGYLEYDSPDLGRDTIYMRRLSPGEHCNSVEGNSTADGDAGRLQAGLSGSWYDPSTSGQGMSMTFLEGARQAIVYWFTYDPKGEQEWFIAVGEFEPDASSVELQVYRTSKGYFDTPDPVATEPWGTVRIDVLDCERLSFNYALPGNLSGAIPLVRLTPSLGCDDGT